MKTYRVEVREVWVQAYEVEAETAAEAVATIKRGTTNPLDHDFQFSHHLPTETWNVEEKQTPP